MGILIMKDYLAIIRKVDFIDLFKYGHFSSSNIKYIDNQLVTVIKIQMICKCKYKTI